MDNWKKRASLHLRAIRGLSAVVSIITTSLSHVLAAPVSSAGMHYTIKIVDAQTEQPIVNSMVCLFESQHCIDTDSIGVCLLQTSSMKIQSIQVVAEGYEILTISTNQLASGVPNVVPLSPKNKGLQAGTPDTLVVTATGSPQRFSDELPSVERLTSFELTSTPGAANDVSRVLQTLPSVVGSGTDTENTLFVRGGHPNENAFLIDGIELTNPNHFSSIDKASGSLGYVNSDFVKHVDFYASSIPSSMPPKLSSAIDVYLRNGSFTEVIRKIDGSFSGLGLSMEGPLFNSLASYIVNLRYNNLSALGSFLPLQGSTQYGDALAKLNVLVNDNSTLSITSIWAFDEYKEDDSSMNYVLESQQKILQSGSGVQWSIQNAHFKNVFHLAFVMRAESYEERLPNANVPITTFQYDSDTTYSFEQYRLKPTPMSSDTLKFMRERLYYTESCDRHETFEREDARWHAAVKNDFSIIRNANHHMDMGLSAKSAKIQLANRDYLIATGKSYFYEEASSEAPIDSALGTYGGGEYDSCIVLNQFGCYIHHELALGCLRTIVGLRGDWWESFDEVGVSPRAGFVYSSAWGKIALSAGLYYQEPAELDKHIEKLILPSLNEDHTVGKLQDVALQRNWQLALNFDKELNRKHAFAIESYYKFYDRQYPPVEPGVYGHIGTGPGTKDISSAFITSEPRAKKKSYGVEFYLKQQNTSRLYYSINYAFFNTIEEYADGRWYNASDNVRQALNAILGVKISDQHNVSLRFKGSEGRPFSRITKDSLGNIYYDTSRPFMSERLKPILSLNARYSVTISKKWGTMTSYIDIINLLNRTTVVQREIGREGYRDILSNGIIPVVGISVSF